MSKPPITRFNPPPNWPVKKGFTPPTGWQPDPAWGAPPQGWPLYVTSAKKSHKIRNVVGALVAVLLIVTIAKAATGGTGRSPVAGSSAAATNTSPSPAANGALAATPAKTGPEAVHDVATATKAPTAKPSATPKSAAAVVGSKVSVGDFYFVVKSFRCGAKKVGGQFDSSNANGQFCLAKMSVTNHGNDANTFDDDSQYLYSSTGQKYSVSDDADTTIEIESNASILDQLNPGITIQTTIAFDVPATGFVPDHLALVSGLGIEDTPVNVNVS